MTYSCHMASHAPVTTFCSAAATCHRQVFNPHEGTQFQRSDDESVKAFRYVLTRAGTAFCEYSFDKLLSLWRPVEGTFSYLPRPDKATSECGLCGQLSSAMGAQLFSCGHSLHLCTLDLHRFYLAS